MRCSLCWLLLLACLGTALAGCPFGYGSSGRMGMVSGPSRALLQAAAKTSAKFDPKAVASLDVDAVKGDLKQLFTSSQPFWPADNGHYGGLMVRLAWHCNGSYRKWDGRGGCNGARIRFDPERSWEDNANLDKALRLLEPIKAKYGDALSWGDLIALAGGTAIEDMGGPTIPICLGRIDDTDGTASLPLGPTKEQELIAPCKPEDGLCQPPLAQTTLGLIYVNPEGVKGIPIPENSVAHIRKTFTQMGMNDQETVALIGAHAFGKTHGACPSGPGPSPKEDPANPWPGTCGSGALKGKGPNAFTSGFEGSWTTTPTQWDNQYFKNLIEFDWEKHKGPGGHWQWRPKSKGNSPVPDIMMLTADLALIKDPVYLKHVKHYAANQDALTEDFANAWYKLMTRSMGPVSRCIGSNVPPARDFQLPLPAASGKSKQADWAAIRSDIAALIGSSPATASEFAALAYQCASSFRATDSAGGCNGARIRFPPQKGWPGNKDFAEPVLKALQPIKASHTDASWADLIVLAGTMGAEHAAGGKSSTGSSAAMSFCPGRVDAPDAAGTDHLAPRSYGSAVVAFKDNAAVAGLTLREAVALAARPRPAAYARSLGYSGSWSSSPQALSNAFFKLLLNLPMQPAKSPAGKPEFKGSAAAAAKLLAGSNDKVAQEKGAQDDAVYFTAEDAAIKEDPELAAIAREFASDNAKFVAAFNAAFVKLVNADRWDGPGGNVCTGAASALT